MNKNEIQKTEAPAGENVGIAVFKENENTIVEVVAAAAKIKFDLSNPAGVKIAEHHRSQIRAARLALATKGKETNKHLNDMKRRVKNEIDRLTEIAFSAETPLKLMIDERKEEIAKAKRLKKEAEDKRIAEIQNTIHILANLPDANRDSRSSQLSTAIQALGAYEIGPTFAEFTEQAQAAKDKSLERLHELHEAAKTREDADAARKAEDERLAKERESLEAEKAELAKEKQDRRDQELADREEEKKNTEEPTSIPEEKQEEQPEEPTAMREAIENPAIEMVDSGEDLEPADVVAALLNFLQEMFDYCSIYLQPDGDQDEFIGKIIAHLDGPRQREVCKMGNRIIAQANTEADER